MKLHENGMLLNSKGLDEKSALREEENTAYQTEPMEEELRTVPYPAPYPVPTPAMHLAGRRYV